MTRGGRTSWFTEHFPAIGRVAFCGSGASVYTSLRATAEAFLRGDGS